MTSIDFFAGVSGIRTAMETAGHRCVDFVEIDQFAVAVYRAIHDTKGEYYAASTKLALDITRN